MVFDNLGRFGVKIVLHQNVFTLPNTSLEKLKF